MSADTTINASSHSAVPDPGMQSLAAEIAAHPVVVEVLAGKRYVTYPYVVSVLIISLRRNIGNARLVETGQWPMVPLVAATTLTMLFGWWGLPMGLVRSPMALIDHWNGGDDLTHEILSVIVGAPEAKRILHLAPQPQLPPTIWLVRFVILLPLLGLGLWLFGAIFP